MSRTFALIAVILALGLQGCNFHGKSNPPAILLASTDAYTLDTGDRLRIVVFGQDNLSRGYTVDGSGNVAMALVGMVRARGGTTYQLEQRIEGALAGTYVKDPKVSVEVEVYRPFFILGEVRQPGQYPFVNAMTVETAVAIAGGYTERANERRVRITRRMGEELETFALPSFESVRPGDTIYVRERLF